MITIKKFLTITLCVVTLLFSNFVIQPKNQCGCGARVTSRTTSYSRSSGTSNYYRPHYYRSHYYSPVVVNQSSSEKFSDRGF